MIKGVAPASEALSRSASEHPLANKAPEVSSAIKLTAISVTLAHLLIGYIIVIKLDMIDLTLDNYRLMPTSHNFFRFPLMLISTHQFAVILLEVVFKASWSPVSYYWYICMVMCQIFWTLTFSSNSQPSNISSLIIMLFILFSSAKLYRSLYSLPPNQTYYYFERNIVSLCVGYFLVMVMVHFGIVAVFDQMIKQQNFARVFFISLPLLGLAVEAVLEIRGSEEKQEFLGCFGFWVTIVYSILAAGNNYLYNDLFTYHQPYHS